MNRTISRTLAGEEQVVQVSFGNQEKKKEHPQKESPSVPEPFEHRRMQQVSGRPSAFGSESRRMPIYPPVRNVAPQAVAEKNSYLTREESALFDLPGKPGSGENVSEEKKSVDPEASVGAVPNLQAELQKGIDSGTESAAESKQQDSVVSEPLTESQQETRAVSGAAVKPQEEISKDPEQKPEQLQLFQDPLLSEQARRHHKIIGQVFDTFWLVQYQDNLYIIDQHAAHEKVLFERMMKNYKEKNVLSQMVSPPLIVTLTAQEAELLEKYEDIFTGFGYEISPFGGREYAINAVPHNLYGIASQDLFVEVLDHLEEVGEKPLDIITEKLASMSCKAAVKGNHALSFQEVERLIDELLTLEDPYHCPHGRPTIISISRQEMEKKFKRIV